MTAICMDESVFVYDSVVRKVWVKKGSRPMIVTTRSHRKIVLFYDGAPWHTSGDVDKFLDKNRKTIMPASFPRCSLELNPAEECWNQAKRDLLGSTVPESFGRMRKSVSNYFRRKKFNMDIINYLCP